MVSPWYTQLGKGVTNILALVLKSANLLNHCIAVHNINVALSCETKELPIVIVLVVYREYIMYVRMMSIQARYTSWAPEREK